MTHGGRRPLGDGRGKSESKEGATRELQKSRLSRPGVSTAHRQRGGITFTLFNPRLSCPSSATSFYPEGVCVCVCVCVYECYRQGSIKAWINMAVRPSHSLLTRLIGKSLRQCLEPIWERKAPPYLPKMAYF